MTNSPVFNVDTAEMYQTRRRESARRLSANLAADSPLSVWLLIMGRGPVTAGFLGPGRITLGAPSGGVFGG